MNAERGFILHAADGTYLCRPERITNLENVMRNHYSRERRLQKSVFTLEGKGVDVAVNTSGSLCSVKLDKMVLATRFAQQGVFLVPVFGWSGISLTLEWPVPADMELRFASDCSFVSSRWCMGECFLFAQKRGAAGFWKLPLPNVFEDGRVCMGDLVVGTVKGATLAECFEKCLASFRQTAWNTEIAPDLRRTAALFRWDAGRQPVAPPADWQSHCRAVSRIEMEELCPTV